MKPARAAAAMAILMASSAVYAFFLWGQPHVPRDQRNLFRVTADLAAQLRWRPQNATPSQAQVRGTVDWAAQQWSRNGRASYSLVFDDTWNGNIATAPPGYTVNANCNNDVLWKNYDIFVPGAVGYTKCSPPTLSCPRIECDIVLITVPLCQLPGCENGWVPLDELDVFGNAIFTATGAPTSFLNNPLSRVVAHEFGHTVGLGHANFDNSTDPACLPTAMGRPLMCPSLSNEFDIPSPDELDGVRHSSTYGPLLTRQVRLVQATVGNAGQLGVSEVAAQSGFQVSSIVQPRIACRRGLGAPDCVVGYTSSVGCSAGVSQCVKFTTFLQNSSGFFNSSTTTLPTAKSYGEVDVAMASDGTVALAWMDAADHKVKVATFGTFSYVNEIVFPGGINGSATVRIPPRISWHQGINSGAGGFVVALVRADHMFFVSVSNASGSAWDVGVALPTVEGGRQVLADSQFDLACPVHANGDGTCRILFNDRLFSAGAAADNMSRRSTVCGFSVWPFSGHALSALGCWFTAWFDPAQVSLSDYGNNPPSGGLAQNGWLSSVGTANPNTVVNTSLIFASSPTATFQGPDTLDLESFNIPVGATSPGKSDWGGMSCDYAEYPRRMLCVQLKESSQF